MNENLRLEEASKSFIQKVFKYGYRAAVDGITKILEEGPAGRYKDPQVLALHEWYQSQDDLNRERVKMIIQKSVELSVYSTLVVLDNATPGYIVKDEISDISINIQIYKDLPSQIQNDALSLVRINSPSNLVDLHDRFIIILNDEKL